VNTEEITKLQSLLKVEFTNAGILVQALTHRSYLNEQPNKDLPSYERLEFLGDSLLSEIISKELYKKYPNYLEGALTKIRSSLVSGDSLAKIGAKLGLDKYIITGKGEYLSEGPQKKSILAAVFESITAAIYLDQGYIPMRDFVLRHLRQPLGQFTLGNNQISDPKSQLQELSQKLYNDLPQYKVLGREGPDHKPIFKVSVAIGNRSLAIEVGNSKSEAETKVAQVALDILLSTNSNSVKL
jgi:ribonuclease-3